VLAFVATHGDHTRMQSNISEVPKHPLPHVPPAPETQRSPLHPPTVFVYEQQTWEHRILNTSAADDPRVTEEALNALGKEGWELVGVVPHSGVVQLYLKRARK
jgi:hypothetical protein